MTMSEVEIIETATDNSSQKESQEQQKQTPKSTPLVKKQQQLQRDKNSKDRTLFCINIDSRCTEDILYELFLQAGPIEDIIRKQDRNGNIIALITYKHIESVDYSIKLFDKILLYGQKLKVQLSQANSKPPLNNSETAPSSTQSSSGNTTNSNNPNSNNNNNQSPNLVSGYSKSVYTRTQSYDSIVNNNRPQHQPMQPPILPPFMAAMNMSPNLMPMPLNLVQFMTQPLIPTFNNDQNNFPSQPHSQRHSNQSLSPNQPHNSRYDNYSRNSQMRHSHSQYSSSSHSQHREHHDNNNHDHHHQHQHHNYNQHNSRDNGNQSDKRSRSPHDRHNDRNRRR